MIPLREFAENNEYWIVAHRGASSVAPENTIAAFELALATGAQMIETDVQLTSDGHIVSFHDFGLNRTTNQDRESDEFTLENLRKLDAGSWFSEKFAGEKIPLLEEVLQFIKDKTYLNIEIKTKKEDNPDLFADLLIEAVRKTGTETQVLFCSFDHNILKIIKEKSEFATAAIMIPGDKTMPSKIYNSLKCDAIICSLKDLSDEFADDIRKNELILGVYDVESPEDIALALKYNVKALATDNPAMAKEALKFMK